MIKEITREEFIRKFDWVSEEGTIYLANGVALFQRDWNGEVYRYGYDASKNMEETGKEYRPIQEPYDDLGDYDIIGWEEV